MAPTGYAAFRRLAATHTLIPVTREVLSDLDTPVSAFWKLRRGRWSFLLESVEGGETWARYTFMGTEPRVVYTARGTRVTVERPGAEPEHVEVADPLAWVTAQTERERFYRDPRLPRFVGGLVGGLSYDAVRWMERLPADNPVPEDALDLCFMATRLVLIHDNLKHSATLAYLAEVPTPDHAEAAWEAAQRALDETQARLEGPLPAMPTAPQLDTPIVATPSMTDAAYGEAVEVARDYISAGDIIQVVVSRRFSQPAAGLHPYLVYRTLRGLNPSPYMFYLEMDGTTLVGSSPEALVRVTDDKVETRPIAGTRPRGASPEEDAALAEELLADPKERAEHVMLVDLARNDVGRVAKIGTVSVPEQMIIERYSHVMHLVSHVVGERQRDKGPADIVNATFPAGTLSGAPKIRAMEIIEQLEPVRRGFYGGAVGTIGLEGNVDLCIGIRMLAANGDEFVVQAGAGIVFDSVPQREADETRSKAGAVLKAIDHARELFARKAEGGAS